MKIALPPAAVAWLKDAGERIASSFAEAVISAVIAGALAQGLNASTLHVLLVAGLTAAAATAKAILAPLVRKWLGKAGGVSPASLATGRRHRILRLPRAVGVSDHPRLKLGKTEPIGKPALDATAHVRITHPRVWVPPALSWPMDYNDEWGDCVIAAVDHVLQAIAVVLGVPRQNWTRSQILGYYRTQNPTFNPDGSEDTNGPGSAADGGMDIQTFLELLVAEGVLVGFGAVDYEDTTDLRNAIYVGIGLVAGQILDVAQQRQATWTYVPGSPTWGGHATALVGYPSTGDDCVSWGSVYRVAHSFIEHQYDEAWMIVPPMLWQHPSFRDGFDQVGFAQAFYQLTGRPLNATVLASA